MRKRSFLFFKTQQSGAYFLSEPQKMELEIWTITIKADSSMFVLIDL